MPDGAPQQGDWFDQNAPPTSSANPAGTAAMTPTPQPAASGGTLNFTPGMTDDQVRSMVNDYLTAQGVQNTDNGQYWVNAYHQFGASDPGYFTSRLQQGVAGAKGGGSLGGLGNGGFAQGGPFPAFTPPSYSDFLNSPGLQFGLDQGLKSVQQSAAAKGELQGGPTLKALSDYATNYGLTKYNDVYNQAAGTAGLNFGINQGNFNNLYNLGNWGISSAGNP